MNFAVYWKTLRDSLWLTLLGLAAIVAFEMILVMAMATLAPEAMQFLRGFSFLRGMFQSMFNIDLSGEVSSASLIAVGFAHPLLFTLTWGVLLSICTRTVAGEIDGGTADLLLSLPISRTGLYLNTTLSHAVVLGFLCGAAGIGVAAGQWANKVPEPISAGNLAWMTANLGALLIAIGGSASLAGAIFPRRVVAVTVVLSLLLVAFFISVLEPLLPWVKNINRLGLLHYYRPVAIVRTGVPPWGNLAVLTGIGLGTWTAGLLIFQRRDIPAK